MYRELSSFIIKKTAELTKDQFIIDMVFVVREKFNALNDAFKEVHSLISHTKPIAREYIPNIQTCIGMYMALYRIPFPKKVTPKHYF